MICIGGGGGDGKYISLYQCFVLFIVPACMFLMNKSLFYLAIQLSCVLVKADSPGNISFNFVMPSFLDELYYKAYHTIIQGFHLKFLGGGE